MSFFSKVSRPLSNETIKLPNRFLGGGGFMQMGALSREPRSNTHVELANSIRAYAEINPEIAEFAKHLDEMKPEHLGLAHDIIDLSRVQEMLPTNINLNKKLNNGKSILGHILGMLPEVSKKNPEAIELTESVISNSDAQNAKYFLVRLFDFDLPNMNSLSKNMKAAKELVPVIAKDALSGGYTMDYSKNERFFSFIQSLCSKDSKPENLKLLKQTLDITDNIAPKVETNINLDDIRLGDTAKIAANMEILPEVLENTEAKGLRYFDVSSFLTKNVNLK